jgi:hypothetical protein
MGQRAPCTSAGVAGRRWAMWRALGVPWRPVAMDRRCQPGPWIGLPWAANDASHDAGRTSATARAIGARAAQSSCLLRRLAIRIIKAEPPTGSLNAWPQCSGAYRCIAQVARGVPQRVVSAELPLSAWSRAVLPSAPKEYRFAQID